MRPPTFILALALSSLALSHAADWPQWRGPKRDGHAPIPLKTQITTGEPKTLWRVPIGPGFSSPVIAGNSLVYCAGDAQEEAAFCLDAKTGKQKWKTPISGLFSDEWGAGTRATPIIDGDRVYVQSCDGEFRCLNLADGTVLWRKNFTKDFGVPFLGSKAREGTASRRGNNGSGIVDGDAVIIPVGGSNGSSIVALRKSDGGLLWKTGNDEAAYSSLMTANLAGTDQVVAFTADSLTGVERASGKILWRTPLRTNAKRHAGTPVIWGNNVAVNSHTFGIICFEIAREGEGYVAREKWTNRDMKINLATPVLVEGHLYSHGPSRNFVSVNAATGKLNWSAPGFGKEYSATLLLGDKLAVVTDEGELVWIKPTPESYSEISRLQICGKNWNHPAYADGILYIRDGRELASFDLQQR